MRNRGVIIQGSSRSDGNTSEIVSFVQKSTDFHVVDLTALNIGRFDYDYGNKNDDFLPLMIDLVENYNTIIFATPVYWYAMSGTMKIFFDRITDCMKFKPEIGRKLRGKAMGMISCGSGPELRDGFTMPFVESAHYLGMNYLGDVHTWIEEGQIPKIVENELICFIENKLEI